MVDAFTNNPAITAATDQGENFKEGEIERQREKRKKASEQEKNGCENAKKNMKLFWALAMLPFLIIIFLLVYLLTYATFRWVFWTRSWGSEFSNGEVFPNGLGQLFLFFVLAAFLPMFTGFTKIFEKILPIIPKPPFPFVEKIFDIGYKIFMASTSFFTAFGMINIIKRLIVPWKLHPGTICPIKLEKYLELLGERTSNIRDEIVKARSAKTNAKNEAQVKEAEKAFNNLVIDLKEAANLGGYIYLKSMSENDTFTEKIFEKLNITGDERIEFLKLFISKTWNPFTFYIEDPNTDSKSVTEAKQVAKAEAAKAAEAKDEEKPMTGGDGARLIAKSWMSTQRNATLNDAVDHAFDGRNDHFFSICCLTVKKRFPFLYPGVSTSNIYGPSFLFVGEDKTGIEAAVKGGCTPCMIFGKFLNIFLKGNALALQALMALMVIFLLCAFAAWLHWWFGCWGWAESEDQKEETQKDRIKNNETLQKIDLMRNESGIKYKNGTSELKTYAQWVNEWEEEAFGTELNEIKKQQDEIFPKSEKDIKKIAALVYDNKMTELFKEEGPEASDSYNINDKKAKEEWLEFAKNQNKKGGDLLGKIFGGNLFGGLFPM